jgi:hypothetical protein
LLYLGIQTVRNGEVYFSSNYTTMPCDPGVTINSGNQKERESARNGLTEKGYSLIHAEFLVLAFLEHCRAADHD